MVSYYVTKWTSTQMENINLTSPKEIIRVRTEWTGRLRLQFGPKRTEDATKMQKCSYWKINCNQNDHPNASIVSFTNHCSDYDTLLFIQKSLLPVKTVYYLIFFLLVIMSQFCESLSTYYPHVREFLIAQPHFEIVVMETATF